MKGQAQEREDIYNFEELVAQYERDVLHFAYTFVLDWNVAEEVTQDVFLKVYQKLDHFKGNSKVKTWIFSITANQAKDYLRAKKSKKILLMRILTGGVSKADTNTPEVIAIKHEEHATLSEKVLGLPVIYREVMILFYYEELSIVEISELLGVKSSTIRTRLDRGRALVKISHEGGRDL